MDQQTRMLKRKERRERNQNYRRQAVLQAAAKVFQRHGFVRATMEIVADEAALAVGTLYRYYQSKEALFVAIVFDAIALMHEELKILVEGETSPEKKLEQVWDLFYAFYVEHPMYYRALLFLHDPSFAGAFTPEAFEAVGRFSGQNFRLLTQMIQEGMERGAFRQGTPREIADFLWGAFIGLVQLTETRKNFKIMPNDLKSLHRAMFHWIQSAILVTHQPAMFPV